MIDSDPDTAESGAEEQRNASSDLCRAHRPPSEQGDAPCRFLTVPCSTDRGQHQTPGLLLGQAGRGDVHRWTLSRGGRAEGG